MAEESITKILIALVTTALITLLIWAVVKSDNDCTNSGGHEVTTGYYPVVVGKTIVMSPIIECEH